MKVLLSSFGVTGRAVRSALAPLVAVYAMAAQGADDSSAQLARIAQERQAAEETYSRESLVCRERFDVNRCVDAAKAKRRERLADLKRQETSLNDAQRMKRGAEQQQKLESRPAPVPREGTASAASGRVEALRTKREAHESRARSSEGGRDAGSIAASRSARASAAAAAAAERARSAASRDAAAQTHAAQAEARAEKRKKKASAPTLPTPP